MKHSLKYFAVATLLTTFFSCKKDNYDPPNLTLAGQLMYQGTPINVEKNSVHLQIYQYGFGRVGPVDETFAQDGSYSTTLFSGDYKMVIPNGDGPFIRTQKTPGVADTIAITLSGNQTLNIDVTPYYLINSAQIASIGSDSVHASFQVQKIITDSATAKNIEYVRLFINKTQFVSGGNNIATANINGGDITDLSNVSLGVKVPALTPTQNYIYARVGLKIVNVEDLIFSPLIKVEF